MPKRRKIRPARKTQRALVLERLEGRALLTQTFLVSTTDAPISATDPVPSGLVGGQSYTLRQLVGYYNEYYNSPEDLTIDLAATTYTLSATDGSTSEWAGRLGDNTYGALQVGPTSVAGIGKLILAGPGGNSYATITCSDVKTPNLGSIPIDRIFHVTDGASLGLQGIAVTGGLALDNGATTDTDSEGGGILVDSGSSLSLTGSAVMSNSAIGGTGKSVVGPTSTGRQGVGYNASGGGIYGAAGSTISIDAASIVSNNYALGGRGGNVSGGDIGHGGDGGSAYGGGIAVAAPASGPSQPSSTYSTELTIASGATIANNRLNQSVTKTTKQTFTGGGTGGSDAGSMGGNGGNAYGAGLYMGTGALNLNGGSNNAPLVFSGNVAIPGPGFSTGQSDPNPGANGLANGAGAAISPGQVFVTNPTKSVGILQFSNNVVSGGQQFYLPTVTTAADTGTTSPNGVWNLRTGVAAVDPLVASGMTLTLNLPAGTITLEPPTGSTVGSPLALSSTGSGRLRLYGAGLASTIINDSELGGPAFSFSSTNITLSALQITGADVTGSGGAIQALVSTVTLSNVSMLANVVSGTNAEGGGIYQSGGTLTLHDTRFSKNQAPAGGAVALAGGVTFTMNGGTASSNTATSAGGGFIFAQDSSVTINGATFSENSAHNSGGVINQSDGSLLIEGDSQFDSNTAGTYGGAVFVGGTCTFTMEGGSLKANSAGIDGGGAMVGSGGSAVLNSVSISGNSASNSACAGGGLYLTGATIKIANPTIKNNHAYEGAGIAVNGGTLQVEGGGKLTGNTAQSSGGGLWAANNPVVTLGTLQVTSNTSTGGWGGGLFQNGGKLSIVNGSTLTQNSAVQGGGAYLDGTDAGMQGGSISKNSATQGGGGLSSVNGGFVASGVAISSNKVASGSTIAGYGGGLFQSGSGTLQLKNGTRVVNNSAEYGGGIFGDDTTINVNGSTIAKNTATGNGGGICDSTTPQVLNLTNANISSNSIAANGVAYGAGLYISGGTLNTYGLNVKNNTIQAANNNTIEGGGLYASGTAVTFNGGVSDTTTFSGNTLTGNGSGTAYGAGLFLTNGSTVNDQSIFTVSNNSITSTASGVGGGFAFFDGTSFNSSYSPTLTGNSASAGGNDYAFVVTDTSDNNNTTDENGPTGINYFTGGTGSLRSAISYVQNWMNGNSNDNSMAIVLAPGGSYGLSSSYGQLSTNIPSGTTITIIGENDTSTAQATINANSVSRVLYAGGSGSLVLQNLVITGGRTTEGSYGSVATGGGIYLNGVNMTLNNTAVQGNTAVATIAGYTGAVGANYGHSGQAGGPGDSAYGGGVYMNQGTLTLLSNDLISGNTVQGSSGGTGGKGGAGRTTATTFDCDFTNAGRGGNGGTGGNAYGGGIYETGGTLNLPSGYNITGNVENYGSGGAAGAGGGSGNGKYCGYGNLGYGTTGANGSNDNYSNYYETGSGQCYTEASNGSALAIQAASVSPLATSRLGRLPGITLELYSASGGLISTTTSDSNGGFSFPVQFSGNGYIQVAANPLMTIAPRGTQVAPGVATSFDPTSRRTDLMQFLDGVPVNHHIVLLMRPLPTAIKTGPNYIQLINAQNGSVIWRTALKPQGYRGGLTVAQVNVNVNGVSTPYYVVVPRYGSAIPWLVNGRTGHVTFISGTVAPELAQGFQVDVENLLGTAQPQLVLFPSNGRSGKVSVIDLNGQSVLWTSKSTVSGGMKVSFASYPTMDATTLIDVVLTSRTIDVKTDGNNWQKWYDGGTGKLIRILDPIPKTNWNKFTSSPPKGTPLLARRLHSSFGGSSHGATPTSAAHATDSRVMLLNRRMPSK